MEEIFELIKFVILSLLIVILSKYLLVPVLSEISYILKLSPKARGNITGIATSVPELLTASFTALIGFIDGSLINILSSNFINVIQYLFSIYLNKNQKYLNNKALLVDLILVIITIIIPIILIVFKIEQTIIIPIIFIILLFVFYFINNNIHKLYLNIEDRKIIKKELEFEKNEYRFKKRTTKNLVKNILYLMFILLSLFFIGEILSISIKNLGNLFRFSEIILGFLLGLITSIPELITFIESQKNNKNDMDKNIFEIKKLGVIEATNNLLTSNVLNLFVIQSLSIIIYTIF